MSLSPDDERDIPVSFRIRIRIYNRLTGKQTISAKDFDTLINCMK